jgi:Putative adhesin
MTTKTFPLDGPINLHGRVGHGSFTVAEQDGLTEATVTLSPRGTGAELLGSTVVEMSGRTLSVQAPRQGGIFDLGLLGGRSRQREAIDITVTVPTGTAVKISAVTADITVTGRSGSADIASGSSTITLGDVDGDLRLRYGSGSARIGNVSGSVETRSGSGDAFFGEIGGALAAGCGSGNLEVTAVRGAVRSRAGSGAASLGAVYSDVDVARGSGTIAIGLPAGRPARVDVTTGSGRVNSELPIEDGPITQANPITVRARTGSGDVRLFRAA